MTSLNGGAGNGAPDLDHDEEQAHQDRVEAVLNDFSDFSGHGAATIGARLYDIVRDAEGPITAGELVDRWVAGAEGAAIGHARRYADERRRRKRTTGDSRRGPFSEVSNARVWLAGTIRQMIKAGTLQRTDGEKHGRDLWTTLVEQGRAPHVHVGEARQVGGTLMRQVGPYDDRERARREEKAERERAAVVLAGLQHPLASGDEAVTLRFIAQAAASLAELVEKAGGITPNSPGKKAGGLLRRFAGSGRRLELEFALDEGMRDLARRRGLRS